jgi:hypothetical protein
MMPATDKEPSQAFTFLALCAYDVMNLESLINIKQFYDSVSSTTPEEFRESSTVSSHLLHGLH